MYLVFVPLIDLRKMPCLTQDQLLLLAVETSLWNIRYYSRLNGPKIRVPFEKKTIRTTGVHFSLDVLLS